MTNNGGVGGCTGVAALGWQHWGGCTGVAALGWQHWGGSTGVAAQTSACHGQSVVCSVHCTSGSVLCISAPQKRVNCNSINLLTVWVAPTRVARIEKIAEALL